MLYFSEANAKIETLGKYLGLGKGEKIYSLDLPAGYSCPGARDCLSRVVVDEAGNKSIKDGRFTQFRCFSASQEVVFPGTYKRRRQNFDALRSMRGAGQVCDLILATLPRKCKVLRYHVSGDFFKYTHLLGAVRAAEQRPDVLFYAYTKSLPFIHRLYLDGYDLSFLYKGVLLHNFLLTGSVGGKYDHLIKKLEIRTAKVVFSRDETAMPIDHDDSHAATVGGNFALLLHGTQPKGSEAAEAWKLVKKSEGGYSRK